LIAVPKWTFSQPIWGLRHKKRTAATEIRAVQQEFVRISPTSKEQGRTRKGEELRGFESPVSQSRSGFERFVVKVLDSCQGKKVEIRGKPADEKIEKFCLIHTVACCISIT